MRVRARDALVGGGLRLTGTRSDPTLIERRGIGHESPCLLNRRDKFPSVDPYNGKNSEVQLDDWLPTLRRAAQWNKWAPEELFMQLAGHLQGQALQKWCMLKNEKTHLKVAPKTLHSRMDPGKEVLAAQDFRGTPQKETESVSDFINILKRIFRIGYGRDGLTQETKAFLYLQLQDGLHSDLMQSPSVSGALAYKELCTAARNEEKRQAEMKKQEEYCGTRFGKGSTRLPHSRRLTGEGHDTWSRPGLFRQGGHKRRELHCSQGEATSSQSPKMPKGSKECLRVSKPSIGEPLRVRARDALVGGGLRLTGNHQQPFMLNGQVELEVSFGGR